MKKKIKRILNSKFFVFILGGIIFSSVSVYAVTYFPSNDVTYDNTDSGMQATDVQEAIDELYNTCFPPGPTIGGQPVDVVTSGDGLYEDEYEDGRYFFKGANPNNYIKFNNELWRIISIENDGTIKIIKKGTINKAYWDETGNNDWATASMNTYLNSTYLNNLSNKDKVITHNWDIGGITPNNNNLSNQIKEEKSEKWEGKIGMITVSEYLRANSNAAKCSTISTVETNQYTCKNTNWIYIDIVPSNGYLWTISRNNSKTYVMDIYNFSNTNGTITSSNTNYAEDRTAPTLYLSSDIKITGGTGTQANPYTIE